MISLCVLFFVLHQSHGIVYRLNATEYERLPPLFHLDPYESCINEDGGLYCTADFELVSDTPSELLTLIQEYSNRTYTHFNHTLLHHGVCVTRTCKKFLNGTITVDINLVLEECYNESMWNNYELKTKISNVISCNRKDKIYDIGAGDIVVATVLAILLMLNVVGSAYDIYRGKSHSKEGNKILLCFSIRRNWRKLVAPSGEGLEPRLRRLKSLNGIKALTTLLVIFGHTPMGNVIALQNPLYTEEGYHFFPNHLMYNGNLIVQTFFIISGFLLAYNTQLLAEKKKLNWTMLPVGILLRWLRLTPPYAVVLAITSTWLRYAGSGPLWQTAVGVEVNDCRRDWWQNLLYINNYYDNTNCMVQAWYLAADMQLYCLGLFICLLLGNRTRKLVMGLLLLAGLVIPAVHIYLQDLDAIIMLSPEFARNLFLKNPTYNKISVYKRGHTNVPSYMVGLAAAYIIYQLQKTDFDVQRYKKFLPLYYATVPLEACLMLLGSVFFIDGFQPPVLLRVAYSSIIRLLYASLSIVLFTGLVFKYENVYRGILEWSGWAGLGRVSYCAYLVHIMFIRAFSGLKLNLVQASFHDTIIQYFGVVAATFMAAVPLWVLVEAPIGQLVKVLVSPVSNLNNNVTVKKLELAENINDDSKL